MLLLFTGLVHAQVPPSDREIAAYKGLHAAAHRGDVEFIRKTAKPA